MSRVMRLFSKCCNKANISNSSSSRSNERSNVSSFELSSLESNRSRFKQ